MSNTLNEDDLEKIIAAIYEGKSVQSTLKQLKIPAKHFYRALQSTPALELAYERAQAARAETLAEEIVEIADTEADPQKARNMIDARKWYSSKMKPAKFGDRIDINVTQVVDIGAALAEAHARASLPICYPQSERAIEATEFKRIDEVKASDSESDPIEIAWDGSFE